MDQTLLADFVHCLLLRQYFVLYVFHQLLRLDYIVRCIVYLSEKHDEGGQVRMHVLDVVVDNLQGTLQPRAASIFNLVVVQKQNDSHRLAVLQNFGDR